MRGDWVVARLPPRVRRLEGATERHSVFVTGGTGYLGQALIPALLGRGHVVRALARAGSERSLPATLVHAVEDPPAGVRVVEVPEIRGE